MVVGGFYDVVIILVVLDSVVFIRMVVVSFLRGEGGLDRDHVGCNGK